MEKRLTPSGVSLSPAWVAAVRTLVWVSISPVAEVLKVDSLPRAAAEGRPCGAAFRVLVAEDDAAYGANVAAAIRSEFRADVDVVGSVAEAMALPDIGYDVAVIDIDLGDGLGVEVAEHVRAANPEAQVLVMSGYLQPHLDDVRSRLDADARHDKSSGIDALVESVRRLSAAVRCRAA